VIPAPVAFFALALALAATDGGAVPAADGGAAPAASEPVQTDAFPRKEVPPLVKEVFAKNVVRWCTDKHYRMTRDDMQWCALLPPQDDRCPELAGACKRAAAGDLRTERRDRRDQSTTITFPAAPGIVRLLLWLLVGLIVAYIIYLIAKHTLKQRPSDDDEDAITVAAAAGEDPAAAAARLVETDVQRLLERARAAAAAGDYFAAVGDAYAALLRKLEGSGVVTVESHRTNGDHVRDVGRQFPALRPRMQTVVRNVEEVQFGGGEATDSRFRSVMMDVIGLLNERLAALLPFIVKLAVGLGLAGMLASCNFERGGGERATSGRVLVWDLLKRYGFTPHERLAPLAKIDKSVSSLVLLPGANMDDAAWQGIATWIGEGGTLLVAGGDHTLPDWIGATIVAHRGAVSLTAEALTVSPDQADRLPPKLDAIVPGDRQVEIGKTSSARARVSEAGDEEDAPPAPLVLRGKTLYAVERTYDNGGRAIVLADDELMNNVSLLVRDNARLVVELLRPGGRKIEIAGELTGLVSKDPITSVQRGRLAPALLQLALLILLFFVYKGAHFGRPVDPMALTRRRFSEHARAVGLMYGRKRAGRHALELYGSYALEKMRERLNLSGGKGILAVAEEVAARTGRPLGDVMRVLVESRPPNQAPADLVRDAALQEANSAKDLATLRDLATLLTTTTTGGAGERIRAQRKD
jgi:hypothetical protein